MHTLKKKRGKGVKYSINSARETDSFGEKTTESYFTKTISKWIKELNLKIKP